MADWIRVPVTDDERRIAQLRGSRSGHFCRIAEAGEVEVLIGSAQQVDLSNGYRVRARVSGRDGWAEFWLGRLFLGPLTPVQERLLGVFVMHEAQITI